MLEQSPFFQQPRKIYLPLIAVWLLMLILIISFIISIDLRTAEHNFTAVSNNVYQQISNRLQTNESVLEGFAALLDVMGHLDNDKIRAYARRILEQYPHIYMFEIIQTVPADRLDHFLHEYRQRHGADFQIRSFSYESLRQWQVPADKPFYAPVIFMEPFPPESRKILGLDLASNAFFVKTLRKSAASHHSVTTEPFTLVEGDLAYLLLRPVTNQFSANRPHTHVLGLHERYAILVIRTDSLVDKQAGLPAGMNLSLVGTRGNDNNNNLLLFQHGEHQSRIERLLFPRLESSRQLDSQTQPFVLTVSQQLGWQDLNRGLLVFISIIGLVAFFIVLIYARVYNRTEAERQKVADRLFYLANHDNLTGLPNRNLLLDRLAHAIAQSGRQSGKLALIYLDLDGFKQVNDTYGHDYGDNILKRVAERLRASLREGDTIARCGGDEFIIILENIDKRQTIVKLISKIKDSFSQPFVINARDIKLGVSAGYAFFPDDGEDMDSLINHADAAMYMDKKQLALLDATITAEKT